MLPLRILFKESGGVENIDKNFNLYAGSRQNVLFTVAIPKLLLDDQLERDGTTITNLVTFSGSGVDNTGKQISTRWYSFARSFSFVKDIEVKGEEYSLFSRRLPSVFTKFDGTYSIVVRIKNFISDEYGDKIDRITTSQQYRYEVLPGLPEGLDEDPPAEPTEMEWLSSRVDKVEVDSNEALQVARAALELAEKIKNIPVSINLTDWNILPQLNINGTLYYQRQINLALYGFSLNDPIDVVMQRAQGQQADKLFDKYKLDFSDSENPLIILLTLRPWYGKAIICGTRFGASEIVGIPDAPMDDQRYVRQNADWTPLDPLEINNLTVNETSTFNGTENLFAGLQVKGTPGTPVQWDSENITQATVGQVVNRIDFTGGYNPMLTTDSGYPSALISNSVILTGETTGLQISISRNFGTTAATNRIILQSTGSVAKFVWTEATGWQGQLQWSILDLIGEETATVTTAYSNSFDGGAIQLSDPNFETNTIFDWLSDPGQAGLPAIADIDIVNADRLVLNAATGTSFVPTLPEFDNSNSIANTYYADRAANEVANHALHLYDITYNNYASGDIRPDTWNIQITEPLTNATNNVLITFYRNSLLGIDGQYAFCKFYIDSLHCYVEYYNNITGALISTVELSDTSGSPVPQFSNPNMKYFVFGEAFAERPQNLYNENTHYIGIYNNPNYFNDPALKSQLYYNVPLLSEIMGTISDLPDEVSHTSLALAIYDTYQEAFNKTQVYTDTSGVLAFEPDNNVGDPHDLYNTTRGWFYKQAELSGQGFTLSGSTATNNNYNQNWHDMGVNPFVNQVGWGGRGSHWFLSDDRLFEICYYSNDGITGYWVVDNHGKHNGYPPNSLSYVSASQPIVGNPPPSSWYIAGNPDYNIGTALTWTPFTSDEVFSEWEQLGPVYIADTQAGDPDPHGIPTVMLDSGFTDRLITKTYGWYAYDRGSIISNTMSTGSVSNPLNLGTINFGGNIVNPQTYGFWATTWEYNVQIGGSTPNAVSAVINFGPSETGGSGSNSVGRKGTLYLHCGDQSSAIIGNAISNLNFTYAVNGTNLAVQPQVQMNAPLPVINPGETLIMEFQMPSYSNQRVYMNWTKVS